MSSGFARRHLREEKLVTNHHIASFSIISFILYGVPFSIVFRCFIYFLSIVTNALRTFALAI